MARYLLFLIACFSILCCNSKRSASINDNQALYDTILKEYDTSIYIGRVFGFPSDSFLKDANDYDKTRDTIYGLSDLVLSHNKIEIRFFTQYLSDTNYCVVLTYDTSFSIKGIEHYYDYSKSKNVKERKSILTKIPTKLNADSLFEKLVENGLFTLNAPPSKAISTDYPLLELTKNGFKNGTTIGGVEDGSHFVIEYKVDKWFDRVLIDNPAVYFKHNPDFQIHRRKYEVTQMMLSAINKHL